MTDMKACVCEETTTRQMVTDAMREDGMLQPKPKWTDEPVRLPPDRAVHLELSNGNYGRIERQQDGRLWLYYCGCGFSGGIFVDNLTLDDAKAQFADLMLPRLIKSLDLLKTLSPTQGE